MPKVSHTMDVNRGTYTVRAGARIYSTDNKPFITKEDITVTGHFRYGAFYFTIRNSNEFRTDTNNVIA